MPLRKTKKKSNRKKLNRISKFHPPFFHSVNEEHVYKEENGKVIVDNYIRKTVDDKEMKIQGRINNKKINITRKYRPYSPLVFSL